MATFALLVAFPFLMAYAAASDLLTMTIPNRLGAGLVAGFVAVALASGLGWAEIAGHVGAGLVVLAAGFGLFAAGAVGGGDAKLAAATALWLGFGALPEYLVVASLAGGVLTLGLLTLRAQPLPAFAASWPFALHLHDRDAGVPYGIALAAAALVVCPAAPLWRIALGP
ncbi:A24 family peptidase [Methylobacterium oryzihabitans]|uniref:Peptidase n=1 Tax=Methylobacterium oryzihabitans TaxID=2499852 RepID=A0A437NUP3_9HYPH|nr:prepilin peptidase [Methylobacterium oryzihabitans]RVU13745.1 peptidase [Methylobacterium oryzihabitans]